jgi:TatD DNase family protein
VIDAHCHLDFPAFDEDREACMARARDLGIRGYVVAGVRPDGWGAQQQLERRCPEARAAFGLHPWHVAAMPDDGLALALDALGRWARFAVGETGLDHGRRCPVDSFPRQERAFRAQLALARNRDLPVILHVVRAHDRVLEILRRDGLPGAGGMVHSYSGSAEQVRAYADLGLCVSFSGGLSRGRPSKAAAIARAVPQHLLLVETDCPDQPPTERQPCERNLPEWLLDVIATVAQLRGQQPEEVAALTARNARRLFGAPATWS